MGNKLSLVLFSDSLDRACAAFNIANAAAASGMGVTIFFSCWGVNLVKNPGATPRGQGFLARAMHFLSPRGANSLPLSRFNLLGLGGWLMRRQMKARNIQSIPQMMADARELGVRFLVCDNPLALMELNREDLLYQVDDIVGSAYYINESADAGMTLFI